MGNVQHGGLSTCFLLKDELLDCRQTDRQTGEGWTHQEMNLITIISSSDRNQPRGEEMEEKQKKKKLKPLRSDSADLKSTWRKQNLT